MSIFSSIYRHTLAKVLPSSANARDATVNQRKRKFEDAGDEDAVSRRRKRRDSDPEAEIITKRRRVDEDHFTPIVNGEAFESTAIAGQQLHHDEQTDSRAMLPPPALSASKIRSINKIIQEQSSRRISLDNMENVSQFSVNTRGTQRMSDEFMNEYDMEKARRHAAATALPPNSGVWERGEKELFFHLSYRGFEPLFPANWMRDFRTMPLTLFHHPSNESPPLIEPYKLGEFRAIRELRELLELGKNVRDQALSSPGVRRETTIERATNKYISWAIRDIGIKTAIGRSRKDGAQLPIHVIVKLKARQCMAECLVEMKRKLHILADEHRRARNIHASIERDQPGYGTPDSEDETRVVESQDDDLPVLYGIMVCKSVLAVFTLNSRIPSPSSLLSSSSLEEKSARKESHGKKRWHISPPPSEDVFNNTREAAERDIRKVFLPTSEVNHEQQHEDDSASDPRFISDFDFSDSTKDVWNALVIAIVAMQIRRDLTLLQDKQEYEGTNNGVKRGIEHMSVDEHEIDDDPDA